MAPFESEVLANYLLRPSALTSILTFEQFQSFFPDQLHDSPQLRSLFRDLRTQRDVVLAGIEANIEEEARRGNVMRKEVLKARQGAAAAEEEDVDGEVELERALFGTGSGATKAKHTLSSIVPELDSAADALEAEIRRLNDEEAALSETIKQTIGALSDLRYGKFSDGQVRDEVIEGLATLRQSCEDKT
ncbi:cnl2/NKP2 family protein [Sarocladium implicatum]|nr:cnl2/NKP2 family protein [Sarocladium implicatum]